MRVFLAAILTSAFASAAAPDGGALYQQRCATCHDNAAMERLPRKAEMAQRSADNLLEVMTKGKMVEQSSGLKDDEMRAIASFLAAKDLRSATNPLAKASEEAGMCAGTPPAVKLTGPMWNGWGNDADNTRFQPSPGIKAADIPKLKLKWAFGFPGAVLGYSQPTVAAGRIFVGSASKKVYSLDAKTGCTWWVYDAGAHVRSAPTLAQFGDQVVLLFGDESTFAHAVNATTGVQLWKTKVDDHPLSRVSAALKFHKGRVYVPASSVEEATGGNASYECCKFRGSVSAIDAATGKVLWKTHSISDPPRPFRKNDAGTQMYGPAGAAIWNSPTIDTKRNVLYVGTGNSYTDVDAGSEDSIMAIDLDTGSMKWSKRVTPNDAFMVGCKPGTRNCPQKQGPDHDFGSSPILRTLKSGKQVLLCGQKSGVMWALDPDKRGEVVWQTRVGKGTELGGIQWGSAADKDQVYVAVSDYLVQPPDVPGGMWALKIETGEKVWNTPAPKPVCSWKTPRCSSAQSAAVTVIPGAVFSGSMDGHMRAYSTKDGTIMWDFDTGVPFEGTVNGVTAKGGSIDGAGPTVVNGMVYVTSGYARFGGGAGNVLLAFSVEGK